MGERWNRSADVYLEHPEDMLLQRVERLCGSRMRESGYELESPSLQRE